MKLVDTFPQITKLEGVESKVDNLKEIINAGIADIINKTHDIQNYSKCSNSCIRHRIN